VPKPYIPNTKDLTKEGVIIYLENWIGALQEEVAQNSPQSALFKEQIDFLSKAMEELKSE